MNTCQTNGGMANVGSTSERVRKPRAFGKACPGFGKYLKEEKKGEKKMREREKLPLFWQLRNLGRLNSAAWLWLGKQLHG